MKYSEHFEKPGASPVITRANIDSIDFGKLQPQAVNLEEAIIGSILIDRNAMPKVLDLLSPKVFYKPAHQSIYEQMEIMFEAGNPIDILTFSEHLRAAGLLEAVGGPYAIVEFTNRVPSTANVEYMARIVYQKYLLRSMITYGVNMVNDAYNETTDVFDLLEDSQEKLLTLDQKTTSSFRDALKAAKETRSKLRDILSGVADIGISTGFRSIDARLSCYTNEEYVVWGARPGVGKTAFMLSAAYKQACQGIPVAVFSLEMPTVQLMQRLICIHTGLPSGIFKNKYLLEQQWPKVESALNFISGLPIYFEDKTDINAANIKNTLIYLKRTVGIKICYIDYLQLLTWRQDDSRNLTNATKVEYNSRVLRITSKNYGIPIIALSQLSRASETRGGSKKPQLSDLRETGAIEQDATVVFLLYSAEKSGILEDEDGNSTKGILEIICPKNRSGEYFNEKLKQNLNCYQVEDIDEMDDLGAPQPMLLNFSTTDSNDSNLELKDVPF